MTRADELKAIMEAVIAGKYDEDQFDLFRAEYGWVDWMNDYTDAAEDEEISESEQDEINKILLEGFNMTFDPQCRKIYGVE